MKKLFKYKNNIFQILHKNVIEFYILEKSFKDLF